jgi:hypothetical protein
VVELRTTRMQEAMDSIGMGRWDYLTLKGKINTVITFIMASRVSQVSMPSRGARTDSIPPGSHDNNVRRGESITKSKQGNRSGHHRFHTNPATIWQRRQISLIIDANAMKILAYLLKK